MSQVPDWQLAFTLPNLSFSARPESRSELNLGLDGIAVVPVSDPRVTEIMEWSEAARRFLGSFHDGNGKPIAPAVLIVRDDWYRALEQDPEPVISFRNAVAVAAILPFRAHWQSDGWSGVSWSESFDYHPAQLRLDGSKFDSWTPALNSIGFRLDGLSLTPDLRVPRTELRHVDEPLAERLGRVWSLRYRQGKEQRGATARVFRSLEAAYEALAIRFKSYSSLQEIGLETVPWTTAIEVLASPPNRHVQPKDCIELLGNASGIGDSVLQERRYEVRVRGKTSRVTLPQQAYVHLYNARSKFVHGDEVSVELLRPFGEDAPPLLSLASTIYRIALMAYLEEHWPVTPTSTPEGDSLKELLEYGLLEFAYAYEDHLLTAIGKRVHD